jgi:hypothetical protein
LGVLGIKQASRKGDEKEKKEAYHILWTPDNELWACFVGSLSDIQYMTQII